MTHELAIVIPAYKDIFFTKTLQSIADQTCKEFTLYIGNDNSPSDLKSIVSQYQDKIDIVYKQFDKNLGGRDLVGQWERCIDMANGEKWIWLFSDDDLMDQHCVENFYSTMKQNPNFDLFHFNVTHIDDDKKILSKLPEYPEILSSENYLERSLSGYHSFVVEYIFRKSHFLNMGRFQKFDLAWCSDQATWIKLGKEKGIRTIGDSNVYFRTSPFNITPNIRDKEILNRKFNSQIEYSAWIFDQAKQKRIQLDPEMLKEQLESWFLRTIRDKIEFISFPLVAKYIYQFKGKFGRASAFDIRIAYLYVYKAYRSAISLMKILIGWNIPESTPNK